MGGGAGPVASPWLTKTEQHGPCKSSDQVFLSRKESNTFLWLYHTVVSISLKDDNLRRSKERGSPNHGTSRAEGIQKDKPAHPRRAKPKLCWLQVPLARPPLGASPSESAREARAPGIQPGTQQGCGSGCVSWVGAGWPQSRQACARQKGRAWG